MRTRASYCGKDSLTKTSYVVVSGGGVVDVDEVGAGVVVNFGGPGHCAVLAVMSSQLHTPSESSSLRQSGVSKQQ